MGLEKITIHSSSFGLSWLVSVFASPPIRTAQIVRKVLSICMTVNYIESCLNLYSHSPSQIEWLIVFLGSACISVRQLCHDACWWGELEMETREKSERYLNYFVFSGRKIIIQITRVAWTFWSQSGHRTW